MKIEITESGTEGRELNPLGEEPIVIWKKINDFEEYEISNLGEVRRDGKIRKTKLLASKIKGRKYNPSVAVILSKSGIAKTFLIHRLLGIHFIPNPENKPEINHKDGNRINNSLDNLEWNTQSENQKHAFANGLNSNKGSRNSRAILTEQQVDKIRSLHSQGFTNKTLSEMYGVNKNVISKIICRVTWKHEAELLENGRIRIIS